VKHRLRPSPSSLRPLPSPVVLGYDRFVRDVALLLETARRQAARSVNAVLTATYWEVGRRIVEFEQKGMRRAEYGEELLQHLSADLTPRFGRGFSRQNLQNMRLFYTAFPPKWIRQTLSGKSVAAARESRLHELARAFPLSWSHYVLLISRSRSPEAMAFYNTEALRGGWSVRQLERQIDSQFYERTLLSRNKVAMLRRGGVRQPEDAVTPDEEIKDPYVLEFLNLRDEYSETELEEALIRHLETFLLELGNEFAFIARQRRLRIDDEWYRVDLLFFHRRLRCLVVIDLKLGRFTHADAGQMHLYLNYAREHWTQPDENPPVGIILCASKGEALVRYATEGLPNKLLVREYLTALPSEERLAAELERTQRLLARRISR
jgi:predicted nuclease of restriction endonuclease-like (RecB) superfamily